MSISEHLHLRIRMVLVAADAPLRVVQAIIQAVAKAEPEAALDFGQPSVNADAVYDFADPKSFVEFHPDTRTLLGQVYVPDHFGHGSLTMLEGLLAPLVAAPSVVELVDGMGLASDPSSEAAMFLGPTHKHQMQARILHALGKAYEHLASHIHTRPELASAWKLSEAILLASASEFEDPPSNTALDANVAAATIAQALEHYGDAIEEQHGLDRNQEDFLARLMTLAAQGVDANWHTQGSSQHIGL